MLRSTIQRTLRRRGTVALILSFAPGCEEFASYPWELLHNGEHFLLASGVFTLTRALLRPDMPIEVELPVYPPLRVLYIGASPSDYPPLDIERSFKALRRGLAHLIENGQVFLDRLEPPTFDELVRYLNSFGGASAFEDTQTSIPCYVIHFDGLGAYGRLCPADDCDMLNAADARSCVNCKTPLTRVKAQAYLCFCNEEGRGQFISGELLRELFISSDVRLAVLSASETTFKGDKTPNQDRRNVVDAALATALVMAQVPAVVAMPFSLQDELSPTFVFHFYEALADGRTLEEALSRARQALLPIKQRGWFIPVLYRDVVEGQEGPATFLTVRDTSEERQHPLAHLGAPLTFVGREKELRDLDDLLTQVAGDEGQQREVKSQHKLRPGVHHIALTGPAGIGKSALAFEAASLSREKFSGGIIGISLQGEKSFRAALIEIANHIHIPSRILRDADLEYCQQLVLSSFRSLANRGLLYLLVLDRFDDVQERSAFGTWHRFLCALPEQVVVLLTSHSNPETVAVLEGVSCHWYEYRVDKMTNDDLLKLFNELAEANGLAERIQLREPQQQAILQEICALLDGYPLGAELIFGRARNIDGRVYVPEAATRSLEDVRDELRETQLDGIWAVLDVAYRLLSEQARHLLPYLATFKLPFSHEQIVMLVEPERTTAAPTTARPEGGEPSMEESNVGGKKVSRSAEAAIPAALKKHWRRACNELVQASFMQFDGRLYNIHSQIRHFAHSLLSQEERRSMHRLAAAYYSSLTHPNPEEWFAAFEHLEEAGEPQDLQESIQLATRASRTLLGRGHSSELDSMLRRAERHALRLGDKTGEGQIQYCLGAIQRQLGRYAEASVCLNRSLSLHLEQHEPDKAAWALYELAVLFCEEGNFQQADIYAQEALKLFHNINDSNGIAWTQLVLGELNRGYGRYQDALEQFELLPVSFRTLNDDKGYAAAIWNRGTTKVALGRYSEGLPDYGAALRLFKALELRLWQAWVLTDLSQVYLEQGKFEDAERICNEAIIIFHEQQAQRGQGWSFRVMGDIARKRKQFREAHSSYSEALTIFTKLDDRVGRARSLNSMGALFIDEGEYLLAKEQYKQAQSIAHDLGALPVEGQALLGLGDVARAVSQFADAERYYKDAAIIAKQLDSPPECCAVLRSQGELHLAQGQYREALENWVDALMFNRHLGHSEGKLLESKIKTLVVDQHLEELYALMTMFKSGDANTAQVLVQNLMNKDERVRSYVHQTLDSMPGAAVVPALLEMLNQSAPLQSAASRLLLKYPQEAIPPLANLLSDDERGGAAESILLQFRPEVSSSVVLDSDTLNSRAPLRRTLLSMVFLPGIERRLRVFLCHSRGEKPAVQTLYQRLQADYVDPWLSKKDLLPGQDWQREISKALLTSDVVIVCLTQDSMNEAGSMQDEIEFVLDVADERPQDSIFILPLRLEKCSIPERLKRWQGVDLFAEDGYERLLYSLSLRADYVLSDYYWKSFQDILRQSLFGRGVVDLSVFPAVPIRYVDQLLKRFMREYPDADLEYQESSHSLSLRTANIVQHIDSLLKPIARSIAEEKPTDNTRELGGQMEKLLQELTILFGFKVVRKQIFKDFVAFFIETGITFENIRVPNCLPFIVSPDYEISDWTIELLRRLLFSNEVGSEAQVAILILYCDNHQLSLAKRRITNRLGNVHARDIVVINHDNLLEMASAKEPEKVLRRCVISQMNLVAVAPYTVAGPTPPHFFFGREHELREISDHLGVTSYILIGGRLIGKTSILNRLHCERLPEYGFRSLYFDCAPFSSYKAFLSASIRDWKPEPPANAPATFGELLRTPPDDKPFVLLMDEVDKFVPADRENGWQLFNTLRALNNSRRLQIVFSGERTLRDALKESDSPFFNFANLILLGPLDYSAIEELVTRPMKQLGIEIIDHVSVVDRIYEFTSGHPNIVQHLCRNLIERLNEQGIRRITLDDVKTITEDPHFQEYDFLQTYWGGATLLEKIITLVLSLEEGRHRLPEVRSIMSLYTRLQPTAAETKDALDRLVELRSILKHTKDGYEFAVKAFPLVLRNTTTIEDLLEVLVEQYNYGGYQV